MGAGHRRKGQIGERELAARLSDEFGRHCKRTLDQSRDGGCDVPLDPFRIECKRRRSIVVHKWLKQAEDACKDGEIPLVMARGDGQEWVVIVPFSFALKWMREEMQQ